MKSRLRLPNPPSAGVSPGTIEAVRAAISGFLFPKLPFDLKGDRGVIPSLDGIRGVAILLVLFGHCGLHKVVPPGFGVTIFFFLSGYLITTLMIREYGRNGSIDLKKFYIRRSLRIFPPCYLVIAAAVLIAMAMGVTFSPGALASNLAYYTNYRMIWNSAGMVPGLGVLWSLAVEEHFYLLFPLAFATMAGWPKGRQVSVLAVACIAVLAWRCVLVYGWGAPNTNIRTYMATDSRIDGILFGCILAIGANPAYAGRAGRLLAGTVPLAIGVALIIGCVVYRDPSFRDSFKYTLQSLGLAPIFAWLIARNETWAFALMNSYPFRLLGLYSYTIYLTHSIVLYYMGSDLANSPAVSLPVAFSVSFLAAAAVFQLVDRPIIALRKQFSA
jgi:peptidoglycan/LPS O-acetylase OafA/YrhL